MKKMKALICIALIVCMLGATAMASGFVHTTGSVNIRTGPGLNYSSRGSVSSGTVLSYQDQSSVDGRGVTWYKVLYNGSYGWISSVYSWLEGGSSYEKLYVRATGTVVVRKGVGTEYSSYNTMSKGEQVEYLNETRYDSYGTAWYKVQYYSYGIGWVSSVYSEIVVGSSSGVAKTDTSIYGTYVVADGGKSSIRSQPNLDGKVYCTIHKGESAVYLGNYSYDERGTLWYYVNFNGQVGWVSSRYTTLY